MLCQLGRVVKASDLKSDGVSPRRFKSCRCRYTSALLAEWSKALRSGRSLHSKAQVRILRGAPPFTDVMDASMAQLAERSAVNR